jgi:hypothetical protein
VPQRPGSFASSREISFHSRDGSRKDAKNGKGKVMPRNDSRRDAETQRRWDVPSLSSNGSSVIPFTGVQAPCFLSLSASLPLCARFLRHDSRFSRLRVRLRFISTCRVCRPDGACVPWERGTHSWRRGLSSVGAPHLVPDLWESVFCSSCRCSGGGKGKAAKPRSREGEGGTRPTELETGMWEPPPVGRVPPCDVPWVSPGEGTRPSVGRLWAPGL